MAAHEALSLNCEYTAICDSDLLKTSPNITKAHIAELPYLAGGKHGLALNQILRDFRKTPSSLLDVESEDIQLTKKTPEFYVTFDEQVLKFHSFFDEILFYTVHKMSEGFYVRYIAKGNVVCSSLTNMLSLLTKSGML